MHGARRGPNTRALGFREIATRDAQLLLNGNPVFLLAALDQDIHPDTVYTVPLTSCVASFRRPTIPGFNCLRCQIQLPDQRYIRFWTQTRRDCKRVGGGAR